jgi:predicted metalloprotease with PDZ domain
MPGDDDRNVIIVQDGPGRGWLGLVVEDMTERMGRRMGVDVSRGALVNDVVKGSPAERAGLKVDDIVVTVDDRTINDGDDLVRAIRKIDPKSNASITVVRGQQRLTLSVEVGSRQPPGHARLHWVWPGIESGSRLLGMELRNISGQLAEYFKAPGGRGVLVEEVESEGAAARAGLRAGDVIVRFGTEPVRDIDDLEWVLEDAQPEQALAVEILRSGSKQTLELKLPEEFSGRDGFSFRDGLFHITPPVPDAQVLKKRIEIELPRTLRNLREQQHELRGREHSMEAFERELEALGRQLEQEANQLKRSLQRALRSL